MVVSGETDRRPLGGSTTSDEGPTKGVYMRGEGAQHAHTNGCCRDQQKHPEENQPGRLHHCQRSPREQSVKVQGGMQAAGIRGKVKIVLPVGD